MYNIDKLGDMRKGDAVDHAARRKRVVHRVQLSELLILEGLLQNKIKNKKIKKRGLNESTRKKEPTTANWLEVVTVSSGPKLDEVLLTFNKTRWMDASHAVGVASCEYGCLYLKDEPPLRSSSVAKQAGTGGTRWKTSCTCLELVSLIARTNLQIGTKLRGGGWSNVLHRVAQKRGHVLTLEELEFGQIHAPCAGRDDRGSVVDIGGQRAGFNGHVAALAACDPCDNIVLRHQLASKAELDSLARRQRKH